MGHTVSTPADGRHPPKWGSDELAEIDRHIDGALVRVRQQTGAALSFHGRAHPEGLVLDRFVGPVVGPLRGARLKPGHGLGGRVSTCVRPLSTSDYINSQAITHHYDEIVRAEALRAMAAAPVVVGRQTMAVLYVALRTPQVQMGRLLDAVMREARVLEQELVMALARSDAARSAALQSGARDARRAEAYADLRLLAGELSNPTQRARVEAAADLLLDPVDCGAPTTPLTPRERDVLSLLALGMANRDIADRLGIGLHTVKDHVSNILAKLGARRRLEAVSAARARGLLA